jgi:hypothetical protein
MPDTTDAAATRPSGKRAGYAMKRPTVAPGWMVWTPQAAVLWALVYGAVRAWWAVNGAPFFGRLGTDLIVFSGWRAIALCAAAAVVAVALKRATWKRPLLAAGWAVCAALLASSALLLLDVVGGLFPGSGVQFIPAAFLSRAACFVEAILVGSAAVAYQRRWRSDCLFCGQTGVRARMERPPRWAWWAAYAAMAGWAIRLGAQAAVGFGSLLRVRGAFWALEVCFVLAGTVLPLALVHSWGRVFPRWAPLVRGRRVPRWLLVGPAFGIGGALTVYFSVSIVAFAAAVLTGSWHRSVTSLPTAFFWVAMPAYLVWGLGLVSAAIAYHRVTRPTCGVCGL